MGFWDSSIWKPLIPLQHATVPAIDCSIQSKQTTSFWLTRNSSSMLCQRRGDQQMQQTADTRGSWHESQQSTPPWQVTNALALNTLLPSSVLECGREGLMSCKWWLKMIFIFSIKWRWGININLDALPLLASPWEYQPSLWQHVAHRDEPSLHHQDFQRILKPQLCAGLIDSLLFHYDGRRSFGKQES